MSQSHVLRATTRSVDLGESFPTHIYLQNLALIQPRTSPVKFARSPRTDPPGDSKSEDAGETTRLASSKTKTSSGPLM